VVELSAIGQPTKQGQLMSSNPGKSQLQRQMAEGLVKGVVYQPSH